MSEVSGKSEVNEVSKPEVDEYKKINPESDMSPQEARQYWDDFFNDTSKKESELDESEADESDNKGKVGLPRHHSRQAIRGIRFREENS